MSEYRTIDLEQWQKTGGGANSDSYVSDDGELMLKLFQKNATEETAAEDYAKALNISFIENTVKAKEITLDKKEVKINKGERFQLVFNVSPIDFSDLVVWKSLDEDIVSVDEFGKIYAKSVGAATIKVSAGNVSTNCIVNVLQGVSSVDFDNHTKNLKVGDKYYLTASIYPEDAHNKNLIWKSSDDSQNGNSRRLQRN